MLQRLLHEVSPRRFYETMLGKLPIENSNGDVHHKCVFHDDERNSLSISMIPERSGYFHCFGCGASGTMLAFYQRFHHIHDLRKAKSKICEEFDIDPSTFKGAVIDDQQILEWSNALFKEKAGKKALEHLVTHRCIPEPIIKAFRLGFETDTGRVTIPILDSDGKVVNVRRWLPEYARKREIDQRNKMIGLPGLNKVAMFNWNALKEQDVVLCEGELDTLAVVALSINAMSWTGGVNSFQRQWIRYFAGKDVTILFDNDSGGQEAADNVVRMLYEVVKSVKVVYLQEGTTKYDATDFIRDIGVSEAGNVLRKLITDTPPLWMQDLGEPECQSVNLFQAANASMMDKHIKVKGLIGGNEGEPYVIPKTVMCRCSEHTNKACIGCPALLSEDGEITKKLEPDNPLVLEFIRNKPNTWFKIFQDMFQTACKTQEFEILDHQNVEEIRLLPDVDLAGVDAYEYVIRTCFFVGYGLRMNQVYIFKGITTRDPATGKITHLFKAAEPASRFDEKLDLSAEVSIDGITAPISEHLKVFQTAEGQTVNEKLNDIYTDWEVNVTRVKKRRDLLEAVDLTYHSPIHLNVGSQTVFQGWISTLIVGDTQTGKSETVKRLRDHFQAGEVLNGETLSRVGLTGGYVPVNNSKPKWMLGRLPLNDKKLIAVDEFSGMSTDEISELTMVRSEGYAESTKMAQYNKFPAMVRMIMMSNPRSGRGVGSYRFGCEAIKELVGANEDMARFDIFVIVAADEVPFDEINSFIEIDYPHTYTTDLSHLLIRWAWTRVASNYKFTDEALEAVQRYANRMADEYDPSIPLVAPASQRFTIAKLAAAVATRLFSTINGVDVIITKDHVDHAADYLYLTYNKPSMGYSTFSAQRRRTRVISNKDELRKLLDSQDALVAEFLTTSRRFTRANLDDQTGVGIEGAKALCATLARFRAIESKGGYFYLTTGMKEFLETYEHPDADFMEEVADEVEVD